MKYKRFIIYLTSIIAIVILSGCAAKQAYEGEKLPSEKVALIKGSVSVFGTSANIASIDGKDMRWTSGEAEALPGYHELEVVLESGINIYYFAKVKVSFTAKAGHVYRVEGKIRKKKAWAWIIDEVDNSVVGGAKP